MRQFTSDSRDAAMRRLSRANRWLIAGSVALTGVLADVAANAFPGKTLHKTTRGSRTPSAGHAASSPTPATPGPVQPPSNPPESASQGNSGEGKNPPTTGEGASGQAPQSPETQPPREAAPSGEAAQSQQQAPAQESEAPVVSGGS
jgi:hypothetical protein